MDRKALYYLNQPQNNNNNNDSMELDNFDDDFDQQFQKTLERDQNIHTNLYYTEREEILTSEQQSSQNKNKITLLQSSQEYINTSQKQNQNQQQQSLNSQQNLNQQQQDNSQQQFQLHQFSDQNIHSFQNLQQNQQSREKLSFGISQKEIQLQQNQNQNQQQQNIEKNNKNINDQNNDEDSREQSSKNNMMKNTNDITSAEFPAYPQSDKLKNSDQQIQQQNNNDKNTSSIASSSCNGSNSSFDSQENEKSNAEKQVTTILERQRERGQTKKFTYRSTITSQSAPRYPDDKKTPYTLQSMRIKELKQKEIKLKLNSTIASHQFKFFFSKLSIPMTIKIQKFISNLKEKSGFFRKKTLTHHEYSLINDKVVFRQGENAYKKDILKQIRSISLNLESIKEKSKYLPVLYPNSLVLTVFDTIHFCAIVLALYYIPLEVFTQTYFTNLYGALWTTFLFLSTFVFITGMILSCNTGYYEKGEIIMNRRKIIKNYIRTNILGDLLSIFPLIESLQQYGSDYSYLRLTNLIIWFKVRPLIGIFNKYEEHYNMHQKSLKLAFLSLFRLILMILFVAHIFASSFLGLATGLNKSDITTGTWIHKYKESLINENDEWFTQYIFSFYWSITTMTTVGYGDITPSNVYEAAFVTATILISGFIYAYTLNTIGNILQKLNEMQKEFNDKMRIFNRYMISKNISQSLQLETARYLQHKYESKDVISAEEEAFVLDQLSSTLSQKIVIQAHMQLFNKCSLLKNTFSQEFLEQLALQSHSQNYIHEQPVFDENFVEIQPYMYIIESGKIVISADWSQEDNEIIEILQPGDYFGELKFFFDSKRVASSKSIGSTSLLLIGKQEFTKLLDYYPKDYERYCMMKDAYLNNRDTSMLQLKCYICQKSHLAQDCHKINYNPDKEKLIMQHNFSLEHIQSNKWKRYDREKYSTYKQIYFTVKAYQDFQEAQKRAEIGEEYIDMDLDDQDLLLYNNNNITGSNPNLKSRAQISSRYLLQEHKLKKQNQQQFEIVVDDSKDSSFNDITQNNTSLRFPPKVIKELQSNDNNTIENFDSQQDISLSNIKDPYSQQQYRHHSSHDKKKNKKDKKFKQYQTENFSSENDKKNKKKLIAKTLQYSPNEFTPSINNQETTTKKQSQISIDRQKSQGKTQQQQQQQQQQQLQQFQYNISSINISKKEQQKDQVRMLSFTEDNIISPLKSPNKKSQPKQQDSIKEHNNEKQPTSIKALAQLEQLKKIDESFEQSQLAQNIKKNQQQFQQQQSLGPRSPIMHSPNPQYLNKKKPQHKRYSSLQQKLETSSKSFLQQIKQNYQKLKNRRNKNFSLDLSDKYKKELHYLSFLDKKRQNLDPDQEDDHFSDHSLLIQNKESLDPQHLQQIDNIQQNSKKKIVKHIEDNIQQYKMKESKSIRDINFLSQKNFTSDTKQQLKPSNYNNTNQLNVQNNKSFRKSLQNNNISNIEIVQSQLDDSDGNFDPQSPSPHLKKQQLPSSNNPRKSKVNIEDQLQFKKSILNAVEQQVFILQIKEKEKQLEKVYKNQQEKQDQLYQGLQWLIQQQLATLQPNNKLLQQNFQYLSPPPCFTQINPQPQPSYRGSFVSNINKDTIRNNNTSIHNNILQQQQLQRKPSQVKDPHHFLNPYQNLSLPSNYQPPPPTIQGQNNNQNKPFFSNTRQISRQGSNNLIENRYFDKQNTTPIQQQQIQQLQQQNNNNNDYVLDVNSNIPIQCQINMQVQKKMKEQQTNAKKYGNLWKLKARKSKQQKLTPEKEQQQNNNNNVSNNNSQKPDDQPQQQQLQLNDQIQPQSSPRTHPNQINNNSAINPNISRREEEEIKQENHFFILGFDEVDKFVLQGYTNYFPLNNVKNVINKMKFKQPSKYRDRRYHLYAREIKHKQQPMIQQRRKSRLQKQKQNVQLTHGQQGLNIEIMKKYSHSKHDYAHNNHDDSNSHNFSSLHHPQSIQSPFNQSKKNPLMENFKYKNPNNNNNMDSSAQGEQIFLPLKQ